MQGIWHVKSFVCCTARVLNCHVLLAYHWRQKLNVPMAPIETGPMWQSQQKVALSCWRGVCAKHTASSTEEPPQIEMCLLLFVTDVVDQTAEASNILLQTALGCVNLPLAPCNFGTQGPICEAQRIYFAARVLPAATRKQNISIGFLAEQHGKNGLVRSRLAGWVGFCSGIRSGSERADSQRPCWTKMDCEEGVLP